MYYNQTSFTAQYDKASLGFERITPNPKAMFVDGVTRVAVEAAVHVIRCLFSVAIEWLNAKLAEYRAKIDSRIRKYQDLEVATTAT